MPITPLEYQRIKQEQEEIIAMAHQRIAEAYAEAEHVAPPVVRPARPEDITVSAIIWYREDEVVNGENVETKEWYWKIVESPLHYGDAFKAYEADDGCRYGLDGAFVEAEENR